ncbi:MAG TPA: bifunctional riboflavin kinase/FAD synthetase [Limnochordia bacterium]|nr:bifunctional riboflavin kinase/FAD synthetase [Limnochordia bacterium]
MSWLPEQDDTEAKNVAGPGWSMWSGEELLARRKPLFSHSVVALGTFDGVHLGHQEIFAKTVEISRDRGWCSVAFTFDRHPAATLAPERKPRLLTSFERRLELILETGVSHVAVVRFDTAFSRVPAEEFVEKVLCGALGARAIVVGYNFRFGFEARGNVDLLKECSAKLGYDLTVIQPVACSGQGVSSTKIRALVAQGDVEGARNLLGRPFSLEGVVVSGDARGRALGYPTANLSVDPELVLPGDGVYVTQANFSGQSRGTQPHQALTVIGTRPSFGGGERTVETFLLDFEGNLYGKKLRIDFLKRLRGIIRFERQEELVRQIEEDVAQARAYFGL